MAKKLNCRNFGVRCDHSVCAWKEAEAALKMEEQNQTIHPERLFSREFYQEGLAIRSGYPPSRV
jgi:hypothetical protein